MQAWALTILVTFISSRVIVRVYIEWARRWTENRLTQFNFYLTVGTCLLKWIKTP